jgi:hypothetical protein
MNLQDLMSKLKSIDEGAMPPLAPTKDNVPAESECGMPIAIGGPAGAPKQQDNVTMNVSMNGSGAGGISDLMKILRNIEGSDNKDPHQHDVSQLFGEPEADPAEPIMGDIVAKLAHEEMDGEESPLTHEYEVGETIGDEEESWGNSVNGASGHHTHGVDSVTFSGDDMNSKGKSSPLQRVPGSNTLREPTNVSEELVSRLSQMYNAIKEERTETKNEKGEVTSWKEEGEWTKSKAKKDGRGKVTNLSDKARRESEKLSKKDESMSEGEKQMSRAAKGNEKYGKDGMKALAKAGREGKDLDKVRDKYDKYDESAKWRDPKHKDKLYTQEPRSDEDDYYGDDDYYNPKPDDYPGAKNLKGGGEFDHNDPLKKGYGRYGAGSPVEKGPRKGLPSRNHITSLKGSIKNAHGKHHAPNLPEQMNESVELNDMLALNKRLNG